MVKETIYNFKEYQGIDNNRKYYVTDRFDSVWDEIDAQKLLAKKLHVGFKKILVRTGYILNDKLYLERPNKKAKAVSVLIVYRKLKS